MAEPRTFDEIMADAQRRIPRYLPEWTDFNNSDPGITLLELLAGIAESLHWRLDQVPDELYGKLLEVLDARPAPAVPARVELTFEPDDVPIVRPAPRGTRVAAANPAGGDPVVFETEAELSIVGSPLAEVQVFDGASFVKATEQQTKPDVSYFPFGRTPQPGCALYLGFKPKPQAQGSIFPADIRFQLFLPPAATAGRPQHLGPGAEPPPPVPLVRLVFEYRRDPSSWTPLPIFDDATSAFAREGSILVAGPTDSLATVEGEIADALHWVRFRIAQGAYPAGRAPEIDGLVPNTVAAKALSTVLDELVGVGDGRPDQTLRLKSAPVDPQSLALEDSLGTRWRLVDDLAANGPDDAVFVLDPGSGGLLFGDGEHGLIPVAGLELIARTYRSGGGAQGNVAAGEIKDVLSSLSGVKAVTNRRPARGGKAGQTIQELVKAAPSILRTRDRAVTADDYAKLAERFGQVGKATALPQVHPDYPDLDVPGSVTVVIVPDGQDRRPEPTAELIRGVLEFLAPRRVLGTELHVKGPSFKAISVDARLAVEPQASFARVLVDANKALDSYLEAHDWPFGQDLDPTRLYGVLLGVKGVRGVPALAIRVDGVPHDGLQEPVTLPPDGLVCPGEHDLVPTPAEDR
jgi:hypothetical protein